MVIVALIVCIILGTILTAFMSRVMLQPLWELNKATAEVAKGNFSVRVKVPKDEEYGMLARNFNKMAEELSGIETLRGDFISNVSHEFKTPLASIQGFAKLLQHESLTKEDREGREQFEKINPAEYTKQTFGMFGGKEEIVTLQFRDRLIGVVLDRFGKETDIRKKEEESFTVRIKVAVSGQFFGWLAGLGKDARIIAPIEVKDKYKTWLTDVLKEQE